jgi:hypothetical protein
VNNVEATKALWTRNTARAYTLRVSLGKTSSSSATERVARLIRALEANHESEALLDELGLPVAGRARFLALVPSLFERARAAQGSRTELELAVGVLLALSSEAAAAPASDS